MEAAEYDITIDRGSEWSKVLELLDANDDPVDLAAVFFKGEAKDVNGISPAAIPLTFDLVTDGSDGRVTASFPLAQTLLFKQDEVYTYDIFARFGAAGNNDWDRLLFGVATIRFNITPIIPA